jgi:hypothetical protein
LENALRISLFLQYKDALLGCCSVGMKLISIRITALMAYFS